MKLIGIPSPPGTHGHWGTGDVEITLRNPEDLDAAKSLIQLAYEGGPQPTMNVSP